MKKRSFALKLATIVGITGITVMASIPASAAPTVGTTKVSFLAGYVEFASVSNDGNTIAYSDESDSQIFLLDTATNVVTNVTDSNSDLNEPGQTVFSPDGDTLYVANYNAGNIAIVDVSTATVTSVVSGLANMSGPWSIAISSDGNTLYIGDYSNGIIIVYDIPGDSEITTIDSVQWPYGIYLSADESTLYAVGYGGSIQHISITSGPTYTVDGTWENVGGTFYNTCISPDKSTLYMPSYYGSDLIKVSLADGSVSEASSSLTLGSGVESCTVSPDGSSVFLTDSQTGNTESDYSIVTSPGAIHEFATSDLSFVADYDIDGIAYTQAVTFFNDCSAYIVGYYGNAQTFDVSSACSASPELPNTGVSAAAFAAIGGLAGLAIIAGAFVLVARRRTA